jgi:hypothetical protein
MSDFFVGFHSITRIDQWACMRLARHDRVCCRKVWAAENMGYSPNRFLPHDSDEKQPAIPTGGVADRVALPGERLERGDGAGEASKGRRAANQEPGLLEFLSLSRWRRLTLDTLALLLGLALLRHWLPVGDGVAGMPHPYWLAVLVVSGQYGMIGGTLASIAAGVLYYFELPQQSGAEDVYAYAGAVAVHPAAWLATALLVGGLRSLHIYQTAGLADRLAACQRRATDLAGGLERAAAEIAALERRIAIEASSVAAMTRSLSRIALGDRRAAALSFAELFRIAATPTFTIYLRDSQGYLPVVAIEDDVSRPAESVEPLDATAIDETRAGNAGDDVAWQAGKRRPHAECLVLVPPAGTAEPLAAILCRCPPALQALPFLRRAEDLSHAFAAMLSACPTETSRGRR